MIRFRPPGVEYLTILKLCWRLLVDVNRFRRLLAERGMIALHVSDERPRRECSLAPRRNLNARWRKVAENFHGLSCES